jgi:hypothetical protein
MISRRPKTRASTENAPGPSITMANSIVAPKTTAKLESNNVVALSGSNESQIPRAPNPTIPPATGVKNPINNRTPPRIRVKPAVHCAGVVLVVRK